MCNIRILAKKTHIGTNSKILARLVYIFVSSNNYLTYDEPWSGILVSTGFAVRSTYHAKLKSTPGQMMFRRDIIVDTYLIYYLEVIKIFNPELIDKMTKIKTKSQTGKL